MAITDLLALKDILVSRLQEAEKNMEAMRGYDYEEYCRREVLYKSDKNHERLKKVNEQIENVIKSLDT